MKEIENTGREILLSVREGDKSPKELKDQLGKSRQSINKWTNRLNDMGALLSHRTGDDPTCKKKYTLNDENVDFKRKTDEFIPDLLSFIPSIVVPALVILLVIEQFEVFLGGLLAILPPFAYLLFKIITTEDYLKVVVRESKPPLQS